MQKYTKVITYPFMLLALTISDHDLSVSQSGAGFGCRFSRATPPVKKKIKASSLIAFYEY